ncbi:MAG: hypothetical protein JWR38_2422 [Mucilaginibacter sp.]|nr:hypothetical protein [Mucilaginibacter sp.]
MGAFLLVGATTMAHANVQSKVQTNPHATQSEITGTTSCGTSYTFDSGQGIGNIIDTLLILDEIDCG